MDVVLVGPLPTPAIALLTRSLRADLGVMIRASHNRYEDNGIKLFGPDGCKLSDAQEAEIEELMDGDLGSALAGRRELGRASRLEDAPGRYIEAAKQSFPRGMTLEGCKIVVDCAQWRRLQGGADRAVGARRRGGPGRRRAGRVQHQQGVRLDRAGLAGRDRARAPRRYRHRARRRCGPAGAGGRDRVDHRRRPDTGAHRRSLAAQERLRGGNVVATVMSNMGLERYLQ